MTAPPPLTDRTALARSRARAARHPDRALFLHEVVRDEVQERLVEVNRGFTDIAVVTGEPAFWSDAIPAARIVPDDPILDLAPASLDLVIHTLCLHWADDPVGQIAQCARALRPDGLFLAALFGGRTLHELRSAMAEAEVAETGGLSPRVLPMGDIRDLGGLVQRGGLALPVADSVVRKVHYADALSLMMDLRSMGETNVLVARQRRFTRHRVIAQAVARYAAAFGLRSGRVAATFEIIFLTGWSPHADQPRPLRPGSAVQRLGEALGSPEVRLPREG
jgi:SAM-dependent methyltransferase